jgi:hypothetical protein
VDSLAIERWVWSPADPKGFATQEDSQWLIIVSSLPINTPLTAIDQGVQGQPLASVDPAAVAELLGDVLENRDDANSKPHSGPPR